MRHAAWWLNLGEDGALAWWRSIPWPCRFGRHAPKVFEDWNADAQCVEHRYRACERCGLFYEHLYP